MTRLFNFKQFVKIINSHQLLSKHLLFLENIFNGILIKMTQNINSKMFTEIEKKLNYTPGTIASAPVEQFRATEIRFLNDLPVPHVLKTYRNETSDGMSMESASIAKEYENTMIAFNALKSTEHGVLNIVASLPEYQTLISERLGGLQLHLPLRDRKGTLLGDSNYKNYLKMIEKCGSWLNALHSNTMKNSENELNKELQEIKEFILERVGPINELTFKKTEFFKYSTLEGKLDNIIEQIILEKPSICFTHNDFNPGNVLFENNKATVFDFADSKYSAPENDLSWFRIMIQDNFENFGPLGKYRTEEIWNSFLKGYGNKVNQNSNIYKLYYLKARMITLLTLGTRLQNFKDPKSQISTKLSIFHQKSVRKEWK